MDIETHAQVMKQIEGRRLSKELSAAKFCSEFSINPAQYSRLKRGLEPIPRSWIPKISELLGVAQEDLNKMLYPPEIQVLSVSKEDLQFFDQIIEAAGKPVRVSILFQLLADHKKDTPSQ